MTQNPRDIDEMTTAGLNLIQQAISIYDRDLRLVRSNTRFQEMFDLPAYLAEPGAAFSETIAHLVAKGEYGQVENVDDFVKDRVATARAFEPHYMERVRANGRMISVEGSPLPQGGWVTVYTDITRVKRHETLLRTRSEELSDQLLQHAEDLSKTNRQLEATITALEEAKRQVTESEARTRLTTEMLPAHIAHAGPDRRYTYSNRRLSAILPERDTDIIGQTIHQALGSETYSSILPYLDRAYAGEASVFEFNDSVSSRRIRVSFTPDDVTGPERGVYILSMDITNEAQTRAALQQTRRRELAAQMTNGLAHDFSNLLTIILGLQTRLDRLDLPEGAADMVTGTKEAARRGGKLLNNIADMTSQRSPSLRPVYLHKILSDLVLLAGPNLPDNLALTLKDETEPVAVLLDAGSLRDSLLNLVLNARDACSQTGGEITIRATQISQTWIEFSVSDTGPGFSAEALNHALDPFFTTKGQNGSGLGLSMVYDSVNMTGGQVFLRNTDDGACVTLRIPLRLAPDVANPILVLLVEDTDDLRRQIRDMLTELGHNVIEATSVEEAKAIASHVPEIGLILSDISLEGEATGVDLAQCDALQQIPKILMTSLPNAHPLFLQARSLAPLLRKPFDREDLLKLLNTRAKS